MSQIHILKGQSLHLPSKNNCDFVKLVLVLPPSPSFMLLRTSSINSPNSLCNITSNSLPNLFKDRQNTGLVSGQEGGIDTKAVREAKNKHVSNKSMILMITFDP